MKKKVLTILACALVVALCAIALVACNPFKWDSIGGGDPTKAAESNGGYVVKQGNYLYYINGYSGAEVADNTFGVPVKQSIVRSELDADGNVKEGTSHVVVPKHIYNSNIADGNGGFAIFGEWIYYATPNNDEDKNGTASTTNLDFMRTTIDGALTQLIGRINSRDVKYIFTPTRILYYMDNAIRYIDFSGMKTNKSIKNGKGAVSGTLAERVDSVLWSYDSDTVLYTQTLDADNSYKNYNTLNSINKNGTNLKTLADNKTFAAEDGAGNVDDGDIMHIYTYALKGMHVGEDGITVYYTRSYYEASAVQTGLYMNKADEFTPANERILTAKDVPTSIVPLGYEEGALATDANGTYLIKGWESVDAINLEERVQVLNASKTVWKVDPEKGIVYYTASSSASGLYSIEYRQTSNVTPIIEEGINISWLVPDFVGTHFYFFATNDDNWLHVIDLETWEYGKREEPAEGEDEGELVVSPYIGVGHPEEEDEQ